MAASATKKQRRRKKKPSAFVPHHVSCQCPKCVPGEENNKQIRWPEYYVGLIPPLGQHAKLTNRRKRISYECYLERNHRHKFPKGKIGSDRQAVREGLSVRDPVRRSIWAPLLQAGCESCDGLRPKNRRLCLHCESLARRALDEAGWDEEMILKFLEAPVNGHDEFADSKNFLKPAEAGKDEGCHT